MGRVHHLEDRALPEDAEIGRVRMRFRCKAITPGRIGMESPRESLQRPAVELDARADAPLRLVDPRVREQERDETRAKRTGNPPAPPRQVPEAARERDANSAQQSDQT